MGQRKMRLQRVFVFSLISLGLLFIGCAKEEPKPIQVEEPKPAYVQHIVKYSGETYGIIAKWYTGDFNKWSAIAKANPSISANRISIGDKIQIPYEIVTNDSPMPKKAVGRIGSLKKSTPKETKEAPKVEETAVITESDTKEEIEEKLEIQEAAEEKNPEVTEEASVEDEFDAMLEAASKEEKKSEKVQKEVEEPESDEGRDKLLEELLSE